MPYCHAAQPMHMDTQRKKNEPKISFSWHLQKNVSKCVGTYRQNNRRLDVRIRNQRYPLSIPAQAFGGAFYLVQCAANHLFLCMKRFAYIWKSMHEMRYTVRSTVYNTRYWTAPFYRSFENAMSIVNKHIVQLNRGEARRIESSRPTN